MAHTGKPQRILGGTAQDPSPAPSMVETSGGWRRLRGAAAVGAFSLFVLGVMCLTGYGLGEIVVGPPRWDSTWFAAQRPHLWWLAPPVAFLVMAMVVYEPLQYGISKKPRAKRWQYMAAAVALLLPTTVAAWHGHQVATRAPDHAQAAARFAGLHDLTVDELGDGRYRFTPRQDEPCVATLQATGARVELRGDCVQDLMVTGTGGS